MQQKARIIDFMPSHNSTTTYLAMAKLEANNFTI